MSDSSPPSASSDPGARGPELLRETANLARLELTDAELERLAPQFERILDAFAGLAELDLQGVPATLGATDLEDIKRPDVARASSLAEALLKGAPDPRESYFGVPKTIAKGNPS